MKPTATPPKLKISLTLAVVVLVTALLTLSTLTKLLVWEPRSIKHSQYRTVERSLVAVRQAVATSLQQGRIDDAERLLRLQADSDPDIIALVATDEHGKVLISTRDADRGRPAAAVIAGFDPGDLARARESADSQLVGTADGKALMGYSPLPLATPGDHPAAERTGMLLLRYDLERASESAWQDALAPLQLSMHLWVLAGEILLSVVLLLLVLHRWVTQPLRRLGALVRSIGAGDTETRSGLQGDSEVAQLARGIEDLAERVGRSQQAMEAANSDLERQVAERTEHLEYEIAFRRGIEKALRTSQQELRSVLETVSEGVALWDRQGLLRYANPAIQTLCGGFEFHQGTSRLSDFFATLSDSEGAPLSDARCNEGGAHAMTVRGQGRGGDLRWFSLELDRVSDGESARGSVLSLADITELYTHSETLERLAHYDALTGLPNRRLLQDRMRQALPRHRRAGMELAVCYLDLDGFKAVNDEHGHEVGDELLIEVGRRLSHEVRSQDSVARLGGDEFVVLLSDLDDAAAVEPVLERILDSLRRPYRLSDRVCESLSCSIGVTLFPSDDTDPDTLLRHADHAMYAAKRMGKNTLHWFDPGHERRLDAHQQTLRELEQALDGGELVLHYQPKVDCQNGEVIGVEALIRWQHPILGLLSPVQFIPLIQDHDLAVLVGDWVIERAIAQGAEWAAKGHPLPIAINVFTRQLQQPDFVEKLSVALRGHGAGSTPPLELEILETAALEGIADLPKLVADCARLNVRFALDDFGTGYSSLEHLRRIPAQVLKIDQTFVRDMLVDSGDRTLIDAIIGLGRSFGRDVVAEGVEEVAQVRALLSAGCAVMQGYCFAPPLPAAEFLAWLAAFQPDRAWNPGVKQQGDNAYAAGHDIR